MVYQDSNDENELIVFQLQNSLKSKVFSTANLVEEVTSEERWASILKFVNKDSIWVFLDYQ